MIQTIQTNHKRGLGGVLPRQGSALVVHLPFSREQLLIAVAVQEPSKHAWVASDRYVERGDLNVRYGVGLANVSRWPEPDPHLETMTDRSRCIAAGR